MSSWFRTHAKAIASGIVTLAAYLAAVIPAEGGIGDVTLAQWMLAIVALGAAYGITATIPNHTPDVLARLKDGSIIAGEASTAHTGDPIHPDEPIGQLTEVSF